ncbi:MAG TPA: hypothetical protein VFO10_02775 [Oligoflexus sp.]|uniref:hypothetical protein n=1 Tax=Oligoflexus sp. TaxID=1971216 RepID=UPI002D7E6F2B|nr:hypothetical protein [Oligoflexus sp.]HET9236146.1 hypothetical protein [Oligoflexus sp.]
MANKPSYSECLEIVKKFQNGGYGSDAKNQEMMNYLSTAYPEASDLIFWDKRDLTPEQILKEADERAKPILL